MPSSDTLHGLVGTDLAGGRYTLLNHIGEGGMADVFRARHNGLRKEVAIKVLKSELAEDEVIRERFVREARALSTVTHDNVVDISDFGTTPSGSVFFVMELLSGEPLSTTLSNSGVMPWPRAKIIVLQICRALHAAHMRGVVHRDMKPDNCWRTKRGANSDFIKVLDFGIAKFYPEDGVQFTKLTEPGQVFGTPEYMSPEQAQGNRADERCDIYSVGIIIYQMVTGQLPFEAGSPMAIMSKQKNELPIPPRIAAPGARITLQLESIILRAMAKDPDERFWSIRELAEALAATSMKPDDASNEKRVSLSTSSAKPPADSLASDLREVTHLLRSAILLIMGIGLIVVVVCIVLALALLMAK